MNAQHDALRNMASSWRVAPLRPLMPELAQATRALRAMSDDAQGLPPEALQSLKALGIFRCARPLEASGFDFTPMQQTRVVEEVGRIDLSAAWRCMIGMDSGIYFRYLQPTQARELASHPDTIAAGWVFPAGLAHSVAGGYRVNGLWHFGSGIEDADLVVAGCMIDGATVLEPPVIIAAPRMAFSIDRDSWNVNGLRASGSFSYAARDLYVPSSHCFKLDAPVHAGPLTRRNNALVRKMPGVALGAMRGMLDWLMTQGCAKEDMGELLARHEYAYLAARTAVYATLEQEWDFLFRGETVPAHSRAMQAMARREVFLAARRCARQILDLCGTAVLRSGNGPLMRMMRDLDAACQHAAVKPAIARAAGGLLTGGGTIEMFV